MSSYYRFLQDGINVIGNWQNDANKKVRRVFGQLKDVTRFMLSESDRFQQLLR